MQEMVARKAISNALYVDLCTNEKVLEKHYGILQANNQIQTEAKTLTYAY